MTYLEYRLQNPNSESYLTAERMVSDVKDLLKMNNKPYTLKDTVEGPKTKAVFDTHFITMFRSVQSTECMAAMSKKEKEVYWDYLTYQDALIAADLEDPLYTDEEVLARVIELYDLNVVYGTPIVVVTALNDYESAEVYDLTEDSCYSYTHMWTE